MKSRTIYSLLGVVLTGVLVVLSLYYRTGISFEVREYPHDEAAPGNPIANARVEFWQNDTLVGTSVSNEKGRSGMQLAPGLYEIRVDAEGFLAATFPAQTVERFKRPHVHVMLFEPPGSGSESNLEQAVDTTSVIARAGRNDVWRTWTSKSTGLPHRIVGSAIRIPRAPQNKKQAARIARQVLSKYVAANLPVNPALARIDLSTLHPRPVRKFKDKWIVTFGQQVRHPLIDEKLPVFGGEASVTISRRDVVQLGMDLFPDIEVDTTESILPKQEIVSRVVTRNTLESVDSAAVELVLFPQPASRAQAQFVYTLAYQLHGTKHHDQSFEVWKYVVEAATGQTLYRENLSTNQTASRIKIATLDKSPEESQETFVVFANGQVGSQALGFQDLGDDGILYLTAGTSVDELSIRAVNERFGVLDTGFLEQLVFLLSGVSLSKRYYEKPLADTDVNVATLTNGINEVVVESVSPELNTAVHLERIREYFVERGIADWLGTPVSIISIPGYTNASYHPGSGNDVLVFGSIKESLALRSDVIYHEYTHGVVNWLVTPTEPGPDPLPYRDESGAINEALADYYACALNGEPEVRIASPEHRIGRKHNRNLDNQLDYQQDLQVGERDRGYVHANSRIFSGVLWDLRQGIIEKTKSEKKGAIYTDELILEALLIPPVPQTFADFSVNLLLADDDDNRLFTGTPDYPEISQAFKNHGIDILAFELEKPTIQHLKLSTNPPSKPAHLEAGRPVRVSATVVESGYGLDASKLTLELNGQPVDLSEARIRTRGQVTRLRYEVSGEDGLHAAAIGDNLAAVLVAEDRAGNTTKAEVSKPIKDTIAPSYELLDCDLTESTVSLTVKVTDFGSGVDPGTFLVKVNGKKLKGIKQQKVNDHEYHLHLVHPYNSQKYTVYGEVSDKAGNIKREQEELEQICLSPCALTMVSVFLGMFATSRRKQDIRG